MKCKEVSSLISEYVDGRLTESVAQAVRDHISVCAFCREELASEEASVKALASPMTVFDAPDVLSQIRRRVESSPAAAPRLRWQWAVVVPALLCAAWLAFAVSNQPPPSMPVSDHPAVADMPSEPIPSGRPEMAEPAPLSEPKTPAPKPKRIVTRTDQPKKQRPAPPPVSREQGEPEPAIEYLVVYNHPGLGDGMDRPEVSPADAAEDPAPSSYSIRITDESTGEVTGLSVYSLREGDSEESATVEFRSESAGSDQDERERSSIDEHPLDHTRGIALGDRCWSCFGAG